MSTSSQNLLRADIALAALAADGGLLQPEQANQFIDMVVEQPTMIQQVRIQRMARASMKINRLGFDSRIMHAASQTGSANDDGSNARYLAAEKRSKPKTAQIQLDTTESIAEIRIPYEVFEDNIEGDNFEAHVMRQIAARAALDFEEQLIFGDKANATDDFLAQQDGVLKRASAHIVDNVNAGISDTMFVNGLLALPQKYLRNLGMLKAFVSLSNTIKLRQARAARVGPLGDANVTDKTDLWSQGLKIEGAATLTADGTGKKGLITMPQNLIWGIQRDISVETDKDIRSREYIIVLTARTAVQIEDADAIVKFINI